MACRAADVALVHERPVLLLDDREVPLIPLAFALELDGPRDAGEEFPVVLVEVQGELFALSCDRLVGKREIVQKTLGALLAEVPCVAGATLIGDKVALILDALAVVERGVRRFVEQGAQGGTAPTAGGERPRDLPAATDERRRPRVLVAEDSDTVREALRRLFEGQGYAVVAARDGAEALALAEREAEPFDVVATDVMMPNLDGYELTRRLRRTPRHRDVPIVMITARGERIDRVRGFDAGVDEYIVKPLDQGEILRAVARHLDRTRRDADAGAGEG
jgi:CheY-like chemotaxis protein